ncbi:DNA repair protein rad14 [Sorochytrium milnesiophthora]
MDTTPRLSSSALSPEQLARIARNRQSALARKNAQPNGTVPTPAATSSESSSSSSLRPAAGASTQPARQATRGNVEQADRQGQRNGKRSWTSNYYEFNLSEMRDTRGGYLAEDAPAIGENVDAHTKKKLRQGAEKRVYEEPAMSLDPRENPTCAECGTVEIDHTFERDFHVKVCRACRDKLPDKYSLLTKTEARQDYLLTEGELRDKERLPYIMRPNPHKSTYHDMWLYLRMQVEAFAVEKWGSLEKLDEEWQRREQDRERKKDKKYKEKLKDLRNRTRTSIWQTQSLKDADKVAHVHRWVRKGEDNGDSSMDDDDDDTGDVDAHVEVCVECGAVNEVEEF